MELREYRIAQSTTIDVDPSVKMAEPTELEKRLATIIDSANAELAGFFVLSMGYNAEKDLYHYCIPSSCDEATRSRIREVLAKHCS